MKNKKEKVPKLELRGLKNIFPFYKKYKGLLTLTIVSMGLCALVGLLSPIFSANALSSLSEYDYKKVLIFAALLIFVRVICTLLRFMQTRFYVSMDNKVLYDLKRKLITSITKVTMKKNDGTDSGIYIERLSDDVGKCSDVLMDILIAMLDIISNLGFLIYIAFLDIWFFIALVIYVVVLWICDSNKEKMWYLDRKQYRKQRELSTGAYNEQIRALRDIKSLNISKNTIEDSSDKFSIALVTSKKSHLTRRKNTTIRDIIAVLFEVGFIVMGALFIKNEFITLSSFLIIYMYHGNVRNLTNYIASIKQYATEGELAARRVFEVINEYPIETFGDKNLENVEGNIVMNNVTFAYEEGKTVLSDISLKFLKNKTTAIVGKSGSGKSTILGLLNRLYDIEQGEILIDGVNVKELTEDCLRDTIGIVTQTPYIFNRTVRENLLFVKEEATEEEMLSALKRAQIYDFVSSLEGGLDNKVGENGLMLSGGQKQRLAIARILLKDSKVIMLDEATSALDNESQGKIVKAIDELKKNHTIIIVAHRLSTIVNADNILVLDSGKIIAQGKHKDLFLNCEIYKELYEGEEV